MSNYEEIQCVILAGGKGRRLDGKGKFSQILCNKTLLEHVFLRLSSQTNKIAVNFNKIKTDINKNYILVFDKFKDDVGPLAGIHAALYHCAKNKNNLDSKLVITVPVDTPFVPLNLIEKLKNKIKLSSAEVVVACSGNRHHPTIAIWRISIIKKLEYCIKNNIRKIDVFTKELKKSYVSWDIKKYDPFLNINDYNDLKLAENMIKKNIIT